MSKNNENTTVIEAVEKKKLNGTQIFLIVFAIVAALGIIASVVIALIPRKNNSAFDYMNDDLTEYVYIPEEFYKSISVKVDVDPVTDRDIEYKIIKDLCANKTSPDPDKVVIPKPGLVISVGDIANIYYRGYTDNEDGTKNYFDGGCNFFDFQNFDATKDLLYALEIGSGGFIPGFEYNLIGKDTSKYSTLNKVEGEFANPGNIIVLTYSAFLADGSPVKDKTAVINLSDPELDKTWGEGFSAYFNENTKPHKIGQLFATDKENSGLYVTSPKAGEGDAKQDVYYNMTIRAAYEVSESENGVLVVDAYFPKDYQEESLRGKEAHFEVYVATVKDYNVPELDEKFITETLKMSAESLAKYDGETIVDKYKSYIRAGLEDEYDEKVKDAIETSFWTNIVAEAEFKSIPESEVDYYYNQYLAEIEATFQSGYSSYYESVEKFAEAYVGSSDWESVLRADATTAVKQKLAFYYAVREGNYSPTDAEYDAVYKELYDEHVQSYLDYYKITESDPDYEAKLATAKETIDTQYDDAYWYENVLYKYVVDKIIEEAKVSGLA